jgi:hypothetical protein
MNTLSRAETAHFYADTAGYDALRQHWSALVNSERKHELTASHHVLYLALLGKDWRKAFTPITNSRKLANGAFEGWALFRAFMRLHSTLYEEDLLAPFDGLVTAQVLQAVRSYLPTPKPWDHASAAYRLGSFPLDAYVQPVESALHA